MPDISNIQSPAVFDPEAISVMGDAYERALRILPTPAPESERQLLAARIIELARAGERDPQELCEQSIRASLNEGLGSNGFVMTELNVDRWPNNSSQNRYASLDDALISLCDQVEVLARGSIAGLTICNPSRTHLERAIFPRLPQFAAAIKEIPLSPSDFGSCVRAVAHGEIITCPDITEEKRFDPQWQRLCLDHGIRSLQSRPVFLHERTPFATFVLAYRQPREETDWNVALMKFAADAAGLIIQSGLDQTKIAAE